MMTPQPQTTNKKRETKYEGIKKEIDMVEKIWRSIKPFLPRILADVRRRRKTYEKPRVCEMPMALTDESSFMVGAQNVKRENNNEKERLNSGFVSDWCDGLWQISFRSDCSSISWVYSQSLQVDMLSL